jgi:hypothetical protein
MSSYYIGGFYWEDEGYVNKPNVNDLYAVVYADNLKYVLHTSNAIDVEKQSGDKIFDFEDFTTNDTPYDTAVIKSRSNPNVNYGLVDVFEDIEEQE